MGKSFEMISPEHSTKLRGEVQREDSASAGLQFVGYVWDSVREGLKAVLAQRQKDRAFIDQRQRAVSTLNAKLGRKKGDPFYSSVFGQRDADGRVVIGPLSESYDEPCGAAVAPLPEFLQGDHVTVFGLSDSPLACDEAMKCFSNKLAGEPAIVEKLLSGTKTVPKWGVDFEDSQTPLRSTMETANELLAGCFSSYTATDRAARPIKRLPGLAIPCTWCFHENEPVSLFVHDFALHVFRHWNQPEALAFYTPKLENEEEAAFVSQMVRVTEKQIMSLHPEYRSGTVRIIVVVENARAIFRVNEIADALHPYFAGASLGWHDFLASTARLYREDPDYLIPVKADGGIVISCVRASHELVARVVGGRGGLAIGGMYGVLPGEDRVGLGDAMFQAALFGFVKDVVTQLKRGLIGFWLPRADYFRIGLAIVEAYKKMTSERDGGPMNELVQGLILDAVQQKQLLAFVEGPDPAPAHKRTPGALIVADLPKSTVICNNDPEEVRYNVFQSLQYLADWLSGNGCVALPATANGQSVRVMDDLATVERSRWEVWHQIRHGHFPVESLIKIAHREMHYIRKYNPTSGKRKFTERPVHVRWNERTSKWYPVALEIVLKLMTVSPAGSVVEFVPQLLLPFTDPMIRASESPLAALALVDPERLRLDPYVARFHYFFERCGVVSFAKAMAQTTVTDMRMVEALVRKFDFADALEAASFHGDIGQNAATLDKMAGKEQAGVAAEQAAELRALGAKYLAKFGIKFLVSAKNKSGLEMKQLMLERMENSSLQELENAKEALLQITRLRILDKPYDKLFDQIEDLRKKHGVKGAQICVTCGAGRGYQTLCLGEASPGRPVGPQTLFEIASLSKSLASAFSIELFKKHGIPLTTPANAVLARVGSDFRLTHSEWGELVEVRHLMSHAALNMHYVNGVPLGRCMPNVRDFLEGNKEYGYVPVDVAGKPGSIFKYSGGGFLVLEHIVEKLLNQPIAEATQPFLDALGLLGDDSLTFNGGTFAHDVAHGFNDAGHLVDGTRLMFPAFAAGALGTARAVSKFLEHLTAAYQDPQMMQPISHDTAVAMLYGTDKGCMDFMGCRMGMGVFIGEAGHNRVAIHQGANDGFRGVYVHCFDGPDEGKGLVCFANSDNRAMLCIAEVMQALFKELCIEGVDCSRFSSTADLSLEKIPQAEIVNIGYKNLVFSAFEPTLPPVISDQGPPDPLAGKNHMVGANLNRVSSQRFARAVNLTSDHLPKFDPELFCPMGKVMDSWETPRHNVLGFDFAEFTLAHDCPSVQYVRFSTKYHNGNQAERVRLLSRSSQDKEWSEIVPETSLQGHCEKVIALPASVPIQQVRIEMFPDGGISRLGLFSSELDLPADLRSIAEPVETAKCRRHADIIPATRKPLQLLYEPSAEEVHVNRQILRPGDVFDAASLAFGGKLLDVTNEHYGPAAQVLSPYLPLSMHDGFESARSRTAGHKEVLTIALCQPTSVQSIELDFTYFVNNNPFRVAVLGFDDAKQDFVDLVKEVPIKAYAGKTAVLYVESPCMVSRVRLLVFPDGGLNRLRVMGPFSPATAPEFQFSPNGRCKQ
mmetsp:Transcript_88736/g.153409  ORF Transcript_88736/g.153409 Transcript_88736/m.153409 type:complete len:1570 (+) Transcript_88736:69-4778(+)